ncbi:gluconate 2-dehydrogenase subunit 3 family protein [Snuella sedimenti]|uniref:Gluconate 2-dehydrogenase subunit 3 family protein n=1 Tax=Snuella sedimenti TaxID=2798802 RepID=A0A8J7IGD0_9FLAO|nr:gluconate 2-dehydrogenase subunit 3 family protein [Snuella sedimenti]MBJ6366646.1 gluconate 2-dehydrogenase subunit 3 family protein [Snuella sedimenti]
MKRREALKKLGLGTGMVVASPALISFLQSCNNETSTWRPSFLTEAQGIVLTAIVDVILPKTDTPSASEVNIPQFIDNYFNEVYELDEQKKTLAAFEKLTNIITSEYNKNIRKVTEEQYKMVLDSHMTLKAPKQDNNKEITISNLLNTIKWMTINAYRTTELIGETVLAYDPVPGASYCDDLNNLTQGKAWSIKYGQ